MDIERFSPHQPSLSPAIIAPLPATVELTGFSGNRHYHEQTTLQDGCPAALPLPPLDCQH
ncbi:hypothetical protein [Photobacterium sp. GSS17]|uniref:hypothetical protein n=1 Tax=Photobacterium sp. GSS17 TaxID=3020715 RepID=UPI00235E2127|nr:hypothetical protein [Photobacterium sp. GSS17]